MLSAVSVLLQVQVCIGVSAMSVVSSCRAFWGDGTSGAGVSFAARDLRIAARWRAEAERLMALSISGRIILKARDTIMSQCSTVSPLRYASKTLTASL